MLVGGKRGMGQDEMTTLSEDWNNLVASAQSGGSDSGGSWIENLFSYNTPSITPPIQTALPGNNPTNNLLTAASIGTVLTNDFSQIFKTIQPIPAGCTSVTTLQGSSVSCLNSSGQAASTLGIPSLGNMSSSTILLIGAALVGVMLFSKH